MDFHNVTKEVLIIVIVALVIGGILWLLYLVMTKGQLQDPDEEIKRILGRGD
jgi:nitrogen fixation-related uncharacterized protein